MLDTNFAPPGKGGNSSGKRRAAPNGSMSLDADVSLVPTTDLDLDAPDLSGDFGDGWSGEFF